MNASSQTISTVQISKKIPTYPWNISCLWFWKSWIIICILGDTWGMFQESVGPNESEILWSATTSVPSWERWAWSTSQRSTAEEIVGSEVGSSQRVISGFSANDPSTLNLRQLDLRHISSGEKCEATQTTSSRDLLLGWPQHTFVHGFLPLNLTKIKPNMDCIFPKFLDKHQNILKHNTTQILQRWRNINNEFEQVEPTCSTASHLEKVTKLDSPPKMCHGLKNLDL